MSFDSAPDTVVIISKPARVSELFIIRNHVNEEWNKENPFPQDISARDPFNEFDLVSSQSSRDPLGTYILHRKLRFLYFFFIDLFFPS